MNIEENRLASFDSWDHNEWPPLPELAEDGFYAVGREEAKCHFCGLILSDWGSGEFSIRQRHRELSPSCPLILSPDGTANAPLYTQNELKNEQTRLATFKHWPVPYITAASLAKAGFFYMNKSDQVKCAWCLGIIAQWEVGDDPFAEHKKFFAECPKVQSMSALTDNFDSNIGIQTVKAPTMAQYSSLDSRIRSFENWTIGDIQNPEILAQAGFYYSGNSDEVRCFYCDGGLRFWLAEDDPWFEHARCFPKCQFVQLVKGQLYIENVLSQIEQNPNPNPNQQHASAEPPMSLDDALSTEHVQLALQMGLNYGRIRAVTKMQLEATGHPYTSSQSLIEAVLDTQIEDEEVESSSSSRFERRIENEVSRLLWNAISSSSAASTKSESSNSNSSVPESTSGKSPPQAAKTAIKEELSLEEENKRLKDARECKICMADEVGVVFCPCGHLVSCVQCAPAITSCPLCRAAIKGRVRTFLS